MNVQGRGWRIAAVWLGFLLVFFRAQAGGLDASHPTSFFTNLAARLLKSEMNLDLNRIQIWPTNHYTPSVHRLLQVAPNIYEATTNRFDDDYPHLPTIFRPQFTNDGGIVFICGYVEETNSAFLSSTLRDLISPTVAASVQQNDLILGFPPIMGVKKGLPNFNEFSMETVAQITRKVELLKSAPGGGEKIIQTNQMFIIGISNVFGVEFWNSYNSNFVKPVNLFVTNFLSLSLTNDFGFIQTTNLIAGVSTNLPSWSKWSPVKVADASFVVPMRSNQVIVSDAVYRMASNRFVPLTDEFERPSGFAFPRWGLTISNRIVAIIQEQATQRIVDCVYLKPAPQHWDISLSIAQPANAIGFGGIWATNAPSDGNGLLSDWPGVIQQIQISKGEIEFGGNWQNHGINQLGGAIRNQAIANFFAFYEPSHVYAYQPGDGNTYFGTNTSLVANAPFTPTTKLSFRSVWQANDPLVHTLASDLFDAANSVVTRWTPPMAAIDVVRNMGRINSRFQPWGGFPFGASEFDPLAYEIAVKDASVRNSDSWNFPESQSLDLNWVGRVHRGTPWQTLNLKATDMVSFNVWSAWTGNPDFYDAFRSVPGRDWNLIAAIAPLFNTNSPHALLSINNTDTNHWLAALDGVNVLTNSATDDWLYDNFSFHFDSVLMSSNSPQALALVENIFAARNAQPGGKFRGLESLPAIPQLTVQSLWLNISSDAQLQLGLTDEAYEMIPAQLLSRLRPDSIGTISPNADGWNIEFTGYDDYPYAVEVSSNLVDWTRVSTNIPSGGAFKFTPPVASGATAQFYRSVLLQ